MNRSCCVSSERANFTWLVSSWCVPDLDLAGDDGGRGGSRQTWAHWCLLARTVVDQSYRNTNTNEMTPGPCLSENFRSTDWGQQMWMWEYWCAQARRQKSSSLSSLLLIKTIIRTINIYLQIKNMTEQLVVTFRITSAVWRFNRMQRPWCGKVCVCSDSVLFQVRSGTSNNRKLWTLLVFPIPTHLHAHNLLRFSLSGCHYSHASI